MADGKNGEEFLFGRVQALGLQLEYDSGFFTVTRSASADQGRDDDGEVEEALLEQLGKHLPDVVRIAIEKARCARAREFVGQRVFVPSIKEFGKLLDCSAEGIVRVSYSRTSFKDPERDVDLTHSGRGDDLLILVASAERPAPASKTSFSWISEDERLRILFERANAAGIFLEHDNGFTIVNLRAVQGVEPKIVQGVIREIGEKLARVSVRLAARARGESGSKFAGKRVFVPELDAFGIFVSCDADGKVVVRYREKDTKSERTVWAQGDALLVVPDERAPAEPASAENSETTWQRLMRRAFGS
jgi:hypothetical protein